MASGKNEVVGIEVVDYNNKEGKHIHGVRLFCLEPLPSPHIGSRSIENFINGADERDFHLGPYITLLYTPGYAGKMICTGVLYADSKS